jgi:hypothetical protein
MDSNFLTIGKSTEIVGQSDGRRVVSVMGMTIEDRPMTEAEAARVLGVSASSLRRLRLKRLISFQRQTPRRVVYLPRHLEEFMTVREVQRRPSRKIERLTL